MRARANVTCAERSLELGVGNDDPFYGNDELSYIYVLLTEREGLNIRSFHQPCWTRSRDLIVRVSSPVRPAAHLALPVSSNRSIDRTGRYLASNYRTRNHGNPWYWQENESECPRERCRLLSYRLHQMFIA